MIADRGQTWHVMHLEVQVSSLEPFGDRFEPIWAQWRHNMGALLVIDTKRRRKSQ